MAGQKSEGKSETEMIGGQKSEGSVRKTVEATDKQQRERETERAERER